MFRCRIDMSYMCMNILVCVHGIHTLVGSEENKYKEIGGGRGGRRVETGNFLLFSVIF